VRFEKGSGLPGQVWQDRRGVIHDELATHPGFLRAAGASAENTANGHRHPSRRRRVSICGGVDQLFPNAARPRGGGVGACDPMVTILN